jgi:uncharacterized coiled-coil protein SlyX
MASIVERAAARVSRMRSGRSAGSDLVGSGVPPAARERFDRQRKRISALEEKVAHQGKRLRELEEELVEDRMMGRRIAELVDVVEQLLLTGDMRDDQRLEERLEQFRRRH